MKQLLLLLTLVVSAFSASAYESFNLTIDDISRVEVFIDDVKLDNLISGVNRIQGNESTSANYMIIQPTAGNVLTLVYDDWDGKDYPRRIADDGTCTIYLSASWEDNLFVESAPAGDARTATAYVTVDDAAKVTLKRGNDPVELHNGENEVKFDPENNEKNFYISPSSEDGSIYRITLNGDDVTSAAFTTRLTVKNDDRIVITANYPDIDYDVTINVTGDYADDRFINNVYINGQPVAGNQYAFKAKAGTELTISADTQDWEVKSFTVNGASGYFGSNWRHTVTENTVLDFTVSRYSTIRVTVIGTPDMIVYNGLHYNGNIVALDPVTNTATVDLRRDTPILSFKPLEGYYLSSAAIGTLAGSDFTATDTYTDEDLKTAVLQIGSLTEGEAVKVETKALVADALANVIVNDFATVEGYIKLTDALGNEYTLGAGTNAISFDPWVCPFELEYGGQFTSYVYLNDRAVSSTYPGGIKYELTLADGDVVKTYADNAPGAYTLALDIAEAAAGKAEVTRDAIGVLTPGNGIPVLAGTVIRVRALDAAAPLHVELDGNALTPDGEGNFTFTVEGNCSLLVTTEAAGIEGITADGAAADTLYNLQGVRVSGHDLPAGLYIKADGTKVLVK